MGRCLGDYTFVSAVDQRCATTTRQNQPLVTFAAAVREPREAEFTHDVPGTGTFCTKQKTIEHSTNGENIFGSSALVVFADPQAAPSAAADDSDGSTAVKTKPKWKKRKRRR